MDLSPLSRQSGICVCGLDFYGEIVGVHLTVNWIGRAWYSPESQYVDKKLLLSQMKLIKQGEKLPLGLLFKFHSKKEKQYVSSAIRSKHQFKNNENELSRLAEIIVKRGIKSQTTLTLEYYLSNNREEVSTITDDTNELLQLIFLLHQMIHSCTVMATGSDGIVFEEYEERKSLQSFSLRLYRLLEHQLADIASTGLGLTPQWCDGLNRQLSVLIPFEMRLKLFRACGLGNIRSLTWIKNSVVRKPELCKLGLPVQPFQIETQADTSNVINTLEAYLELLRQIPSQSEWSIPMTVKLHHLYTWKFPLTFDEISFEEVIIKQSFRSPYATPTFIQEPDPTEINPYSWDLTPPMNTKTPET
ncbi:hypothetical protein ACTXT7_016735 [Hymenolepis weldensis]